jgi:hypothetical protein
MQDAKVYRQYATDCRRLAATMKAKDGRILLQMAEAWDVRAEEAEKTNPQKTNGHDKSPPPET